MKKLPGRAAANTPPALYNCSVKIGTAIRRKSLQPLQQHREGRDGCPDHERPGPSQWTPRSGIGWEIDQY
jgi:hypothetical protein